MKTDIQRAVIYAVAGLVASLLLIAVVVSCAAYDAGHITYGH